MADQPFDLKDFKPPNISAKSLKLIVVGGLLLILVWSSWFTISAEEVGVVQTFGKYSRTVNPGLNFKICFSRSFTLL